MKFIIPTQEFNYLLNRVQNAVPVKPTVPVQGNILIELAAGTLTLTGSDNTVAVQCETDVKMLEEGRIALPARRLVPLVRELTAPNLEFSTDENHCAEIISGSSRFKIHGMKGNDYPKLPDMAGATRFKIPQKALKDLLFQVSFAIARDDSRAVLTGALMRVANGQVTFMGTDGKRLARAHQTIALDPSFSGSYVLPLKAIDELLKNLVEENGEAAVSLLSDKISVEAGKTKVIAVLLAGEYPDVHRVIPEKSDLMVTLHREELISLLRQMSLFTSDEFHSVKFTFLDSELRLTANSIEVGEGKVSMPVNYRGPEFQIAFSPTFFLDALRHSKEETVTLGLTDPYNPGVLTDQEGGLQHPHGASPLFVVMPMRIQHVAT